MNELIKEGWNKDDTKHMSYKFTSICHDAPLVQKMLFNDKPVAKGFEIYSTSNEPIHETRHREWWQIWKPKSWQVRIGVMQVIVPKYVTYRYYCTKCDKRNNGKW